MATTTIKFNIPKRKAEKINRIALSEGLTLNDFFKKISFQLSDIPKNRYNKRSDLIKSVISDFIATGLYTEGFLKDLKNGLNKSSYAR